MHVYARSRLTANGDHGRTAFTVIELLVTVSIIGVLLALIVPAVMSSRAAARNLHCKNHLKNLALAIHASSRLKGRLPAVGNFGAEDSPNRHKPYHSWVVDLLPWLDQRAIWREWDFDQPFNIGHNAELTRLGVPVLVCPDDDTTSGGGDLSYVVNGGFGWTSPIDCPAAMHPGSPSGPSMFPFDLNGNGTTCVPPDQDELDGTPSDREIFKRTGLFFVENWPYGSGTVRHHSLDTVIDGQGQTLMLSENVRVGSDPFHQDTNWGNPYPWRNCFFLSAYVCENASCVAASVDYGRGNDRGHPDYRLEAINAGLKLPEGEAPWPSSYHVGGVNVAYADGRVAFLDEQIDGRVYSALVSPQGSLLEDPLTQAISGDE